MNKEKQIEEMARIIGHCESTLHPDIECHNKATGCYCIENPCHNQRIADKLYNAGYRKQEWISVEDRLPEGKVNCLVHYKHAYCDNDGYWAIGVSFYDGHEFHIGVEYKVTHWMPLPEAPKMKGGAE